MEEEFLSRKIIHVDMDAFFASVEQLDNPDLRGKPVAVGGSEERGVVSAASYEARKFNVKSALSGRIAKERCPHLIFVPPRFDRYKEISNIIRSIFLEFTDLVEPLSLDEAFLDVTENKQNNPSASLIALEIRKRIYQETGLTASAGISINKFLAKVASDINKPNGQKTIKPEEVLPFLEELPVAKFFGVGKVTAQKMYKLGIYKGLDLKNKSIEELQLLFGKSGKHYYNIVRGIQHSQVSPNRTRKSIAAERTFVNDISDESKLIEKLSIIGDELDKRLKKNKAKGKTVTLKIKYHNFTVQTRSKTTNEYIGAKTEFQEIVLKLLKQEQLLSPVRLLGIAISNLDNQKEIEKWIQLRFKFEKD